MYQYYYEIFNANSIQLMDDIHSAMGVQLYATSEGAYTDGYIDYTNPNLTINTYNPLSFDQMAIMGIIIAEHSYQDSYCPKKFYKLNNSMQDPTSIDYEKLGLITNKTFVGGELRQVDYYEDYISSSTTYDNIIIREFRHYTRNPIGIVQYRTKTVNYITGDDSTGLTVVSTKFYSPQDALVEGKIRRENVISAAKTIFLTDLAMNYGVPTNQIYGFDLVANLLSDILIYIEGYDAPLLAAVSASTKPYMGVCQKESITASTIVNSSASQTDIITINGVNFAYTSSSTPTQSEIANGFINLITGTTATSVSNYVTINPVNISSGVFNITSTIPGWPFTISATSNVSTALLVANNNKTKLDLINALTY